MPRPTSIRSWRKKASTAAMLPSWITAVTDTPGSPQPSSTGTTLRWAVLLMGRNSVRPCTTPSTRARQQATTMPTPSWVGMATASAVWKGFAMATNGLGKTGGGLGTR